MPPFADVLQWEHLPFPKSLRDFQRLFPDDDACGRYLEGAKWPQGFTCPHCQEKGEPVRLAMRPGVLAEAQAQQQQTGIDQMATLVKTGAEASHAEQAASLAKQRASA